jgi:hypothetical protein
MEITKRIGIFGRTFFEGTEMFGEILSNMRFKDIASLDSRAYNFITKDGVFYSVYGADKTSEGLPQVDEACVSYCMTVVEYQKYVHPLLKSKSAKVRIFPEDAFSTENKR